MTYFQRFITIQRYTSNTTQVVNPVGCHHLCIVVRKIIRQQLWLSATDWGEPVNIELPRAYGEVYGSNYQHWKRFRYLDD